MTGVSGLQQILRKQGLEWGDSAQNDYHLWFDGGTLRTDATFAASGGLGVMPALNVKDVAYGAVDDGVTDNAAAINAALTAAGVLGYKWVVLDGLTFGIKSNLLIPTNVGLWFTHGTTLKGLATFTGTSDMISNSDHVNGNGFIRVSGSGIIDCNNVTNYGIHVYGSLQTSSGKDGFWVEGLEIKNALLDGYITEQSSSGARNAIAYADKLIVHDCSRHGIQFTNNDSHHIIGCTIFSTAQHGILLSQTADGAVLGNNIYSTTLLGISINAASWISIGFNNIHTILQNGINVGASDNVSIIGNNLYDIGFQADSSYVGIYLGTGTLYCTVQGNTIKQLAASKVLAVGIQEAGTANFNSIQGNTFDDRLKGITTKVARVGANTQVRNNPGHMTENQGTATIASATTSILVNHGLAVTPTLANIVISQTNNPTNTVKYWISTPTATQFTINASADPGASGATFVWSAAVL